MDNEQNGIDSEQLDAEQPVTSKPLFKFLTSAAFSRKRKQNFIGCNFETEEIKYQENRKIRRRAFDHYLAEIEANIKALAITTGAAVSISVSLAMKIGGKLQYTRSFKGAPSKEKKTERSKQNQDGINGVKVQKKGSAASVPDDKAMLPQAKLTKSREMKTVDKERKLDCDLDDSEGYLVVEKPVMTEEEPVSTVEFFQALTKTNTARIKKNLFIGCNFDVQQIIFQADVKKRRRAFYFYLTELELFGKALSLTTGSSVTIVTSLKSTRGGDLLYAKKFKGLAADNINDWLENKDPGADITEEEDEAAGLTDVKSELQRRMEKKTAGKKRKLDCYLKDNEGDLAVDKAVVTEEEPVSTVDLFQAVTKANSGRIKKNLFIGCNFEKQQIEFQSNPIKRKRAFYFYLTELELNGKALCLTTGSSVTIVTSPKTSGGGDLHYAKKFKGPFGDKITEGLENIEPGVAKEDKEAAEETAGQPDCEQSTKPRVVKVAVKEKPKRKIRLVQPLAQQPKKERPVNTGTIMPTFKSEAKDGSSLIVVPVEFESGLNPELWDDAPSECAAEDYSKEDLKEEEQNAEEPNDEKGDFSDQDLKPEKFSEEPNGLSDDEGGHSDHELKEEKESADSIKEKSASDWFEEIGENAVESFAVDGGQISMDQDSKIAITALSRAARFVCDQCGYLAANPTDLKTHKESKHEGIRYPCDQCDYIAKLPSYLKKHKRSRHAL